MATIGFKGVGWILGFAVVSPACYMVSSQVAGERARVEEVERAIIVAQRDIRSLETEFDTRANMSQLERYNGEMLALSAPRPDQFINGETSLAALSAPQGTAHYASLVVPAGVPEPTVESTTAVAAVSAPVPVVPATAPAKAMPKAQAVAMLDRKLLSDSVIGELVSGARTEQSKR